jgi:hypothetical protein
MRINRLIQQKKFLSSVILLNDGIDKIFSEVRLLQSIS